MIKVSTQKAQAAVEYMLVFAAICVVVVLALAPNGFVTKAVEESIDSTVVGLEEMASNIYYDVDNE